jgi:hypothetical protein
MFVSLVPGGLAFACVAVIVPESSKGSLMRIKHVRPSGRGLLVTAAAAVFVLPCTGAVVYQNSFDAEANGTLPAGWTSTLSPNTSIGVQPAAGGKALSTSLTATSGQIGAFVRSGAGFSLPGTAGQDLSFELQVRLDAASDPAPVERYNYRTFQFTWGGASRADVSDPTSGYGASFTLFRGPEGLRSWVSAGEFGEAMTFNTGSVLDVITPALGDVYNLRIDIAYVDGQMQGRYTVTHGAESAVVRFADNNPDSGDYYALRAQCSGTYNGGVPVSMTGSFDNLLIQTPEPATTLVGSVAFSALAVLWQRPARRRERP